MSSTKRCTKCGEVKSLDEFHRNRRKPLGRHSYCRACRREYNRIWREANRDRYREYQREYQRIWRESNRDRYREYRRKYNAANRDRRREYSRAWYEANRDHHLECVRAWYEANRDRHREAKHRRRARKRSTTVEEFSLADVYAWWEELGAYTVSGAISPSPRATVSTSTMCGPYPVAAITRYEISSPRANAATWRNTLRSPTSSRSAPTRSGSLQRPSDSPPATWRTLG